MNTSIKYFLHRFHYLIVALILIAVGLASVVLFHNGEDWKILWPAVGAAISLIYIIEKQQLDEAVLFKQLFTEFNARYDQLNEPLNRILNTPKEELNDDVLQCLNDYFNLCGEEYLYFRNGFVYPEVWKSWVNGMTTFYSNEVIKEIWDKELKSESYYGLDIRKEIDKIRI